MVTQRVHSQPYSSPFCRIMEVDLDGNFLLSNTEPIDGGDDPDIDW